MHCFNFTCRKCSSFHPLIWQWVGCHFHKWYQVQRKYPSFIHLEFFLYDAFHMLYMIFNVVGYLDSLFWWMYHSKRGLIVCILYVSGSCSWEEDHWLFVSWQQWRFIQWPFISTTQLEVKTLSPVWIFHILARGVYLDLIWNKQINYMSALMVG